MRPLPDFDAVLLTGGGARRMGGADKPARTVDGAPLVARVAAAVAHAARVVVVGPSYPDVRADVVTREEPAGGGPVAATAAALPHVTAARVALLAADLPFLTGEAVDLLRYAVEGFTASTAANAAAPADPARRGDVAAVTDQLGTTVHSHPDVALLVDGDGRDQLLVAVWRTDSLRTALSTMDGAVGAVGAVGAGGTAGTGGTVGLAGVPMRRVLAAAGTVSRQSVTLGPRDVPPWFDCDTDDDLARAERFARGDQHPDTT